MCFVKSHAVEQQQPVPIQPQDPVVRHQADAQTTKNSQENSTQGFKQNIKTSALGLEDIANTEKKTLLGE